MSSTPIAGTVAYLGNTYTIAGLENASHKAVDIYVQPAAAFHDELFDQSKMPTAWKDKQKKPVVIQRDGKYVFIYRPDGLNAEAGFKARLIAKYCLAQAKHQPQVNEPEAPQYNAGYDQRQYTDRRYERTRPNASGYNNDRPRQFGGGNSTNRFGGRSY